MGVKVAFPSGPRLAANNRTDLNILTLTDSTGEDYSEWPGRFLELLAAANPHLSFTYEQWWNGLGGEWSGESVKQTGTGTKTVKLWNGGGGGYTAEDITEDIYLYPDALDYVVFGLGLNGTTGYETLVTDVQAAWPDAFVTLSTQCTRDSGSGYATYYTNTYVRELAATLETGFMDIEPVFDALSNPENYFSDIVHPNSSGQQLWADTVYSYWSASTSLTLQSRRAAA